MKRGAVLSAPERLLAHDLAVEGGRRQPISLGPEVFGDDEFAQPPAGHLVVRVAEHARELLVHAGHAVLRIDEHDGLRRPVEEGGEVAALHLESPLGLDLLGDVEPDPQDAHQAGTVVYRNEDAAQGPVVAPPTAAEPDLVFLGGALEHPGEDALRLGQVVAVHPVGPRPSVHRGLGRDPEDASTGGVHRHDAARLVEFVHHGGVVVVEGSVAPPSLLPGPFRMQPLPLVPGHDDHAGGAATVQDRPQGDRDRDGLTLPGHEFQRRRRRRLRIQPPALAVVSFSSPGTQDIVDGSAVQPRLGAALEGC